MTLLRPSRTLLLLCLLAAAGTVVHAEGQRSRGGMGGHMGGMGGGMPSRGPRDGIDAPNVRAGGSNSARSGRWWDDKKFAKSLGLNSDQQKRMDHVFAQNRDVLQQRYDTFVKEQAKLDTLKHNNNASENDLFSQIEHTAQARTELEQAYTHMQLQIRGELTPEQVNKLEEQH